MPPAACVSARFCPSHITVWMMVFLRLGSHFRVFVEAWLDKLVAGVYSCTFFRCRINSVNVEHTDDALERVESLRQSSCGLLKGVPGSFTARLEHERGRDNGLMEDHVQEMYCTS